MVEGGHRRPKSVPLIPDPVRKWHPNVLEGNRPGVRSSLPHVVFFLPHDDSLGFPGDDEGAHPPVSFRGVGVGENEVPIGDAAVGNPHLAAVEHVIVAVAGRRGLNGPDVATSSGLGDTVGSQMELARERAQPLALLLVGPRDDHGALGERVRFHGGADPGAAPGDFLRDQAALQDPEPESAVLRRDMGVHEPELPRLPADLHRILARLVVMAGLGNDLVSSELAGEVSKLLLVVAEVEIDHVSAAPSTATRAEAPTPFPR